MLKQKLHILFVLISISFFSQKGTTTFGIQYKPILPIEVFNVENLVMSNNDFSSTVSSRLGHNFGGIIRWGFSKSLSLETGISYVKRNYKMENIVNSSSTNSIGNFSIVGYEIPIQGLIYVQLNKNYFLNVSTGISANWLASDVATVSKDLNFKQYTFTKKLSLSYIANVGIEYRTKDKGFFYLGASLNTPFFAMGLINVTYDEFNTPIQKLSGDIMGNYITLDLRYFFNEKKSKKKNNTK